MGCELCASMSYLGSASPMPRFVVSEREILGKPSINDRKRFIALQTNRDFVLFHTSKPQTTSFAI